RLANPEDSLTGGRGMVDRATITLRNPSGRFSSLLTTGALYSDLQGGGAYHAPMYLEVSINGGDYARIFTGVIKLPQEGTPTARGEATIVLDCRSRDEAALSARVSTSQAVFAQIYNEGWTEEQIVAQWLTSAGLTDGTDFVSQAYATAHSVTATLDPGLWVIPWAWLDDESPIEDGWGLAAAVGGRLYVDPDGIYRYENAQHWLMSPHDSSRGTLDRDDFQDMRAAWNDRELFSGVTVEISPRETVDSGQVWEADQVLSVPPGVIKTVLARLSAPVYGSVSVTYVAVTSGGQDITGDVTVTPTQNAQRVSLAIQNTHASHAANLVVLKLTGQAVEDGPTGEASEESSETFWSSRLGRRRRLRGNPYIQTEALAGMVAEFLRDRHQLPRLSFGVSGVPGVPSRRLGDRLTLDDPKTMSASRDGFVVGVDWRLDNGGFWQDLTLLDATGLYPYGDTTPGYFIIGTSSLKASNSDYLFY
ncbi:MAG: hypothetical protein WAU10_07800, partial [Caldilineaceae bacterium]